MPNASRLLESPPEIAGSTLNQACESDCFAKISVSSAPSDPSLPDRSQLVEASLAACVNIVPQVTSIYKWKGKLERDQELLLIIKSRESRLPELTAFVRQHHPYETCEVISFPVGAVFSLSLWPDR